MTALLTVTADEERELATTVLRAHGAGQEEADVQARVLVEADLRDRHSHGIQRLPTLVGRMRNGLLQPMVEPELRWVSDAFLAVDGGFGFGPATAMQAIAALLERAARTGVALAAVRRSSHLGMLAPYAERIADDRCVGIVLTTSEALVHPWGGRLPLVGTNPIAVAVPTAGDPFILDMSTSAISMGQVLAFDQRGLELPEGAAVDADGLPTRDAGRARAGALSPFGGAKGYALGLAVELLVAGLTTTALGADVAGTLDVEHAVTKGDVVIVVDPRAAGVEGLEARVEAFLDELRSSPPAAGGDGVAIPGDRAREVRAMRLASGIPLPRALWEQLTALHVEAEELARA
ncbi:MAG: hypothetical protein V7607_1685 [Solirubrobacteraceae bacterium]